MEYEQIFHITHIGKYYCKNMKYRIKKYIYIYCILIKRVPEEPEDGSTNFPFLFHDQSSRALDKDCGSNDNPLQALILAVTI